MPVLRFKGREELARVALLLEVRQYTEHVDGLAVAEQARIDLLRGYPADLQVGGIVDEEGREQKFRLGGGIRVIGR